MRRSVTAITLLVALAAPAAASAGGSTQPDRTYQRYALVRDKLMACALDGQARHLGPIKRRQCPGLRRRYAIFSFYGVPSSVFLICKTRRCPAGPDGVPNPRGSAPPEAVRIYG